MTDFIYDSVDIFDKIILDVSRKLNLASTDFLAEIGIDNGTISNKLSESVKSVVGFDRSKQNIEQAKYTGKRRCKFVLSDIPKISFDDSVFSKAFVFYESDVFDFDKSVVVLLKELVRICDNNALVLLYSIPTSYAQDLIVKKLEEMNIFNVWNFKNLEANKYDLLFEVKKYEQSTR